MSYDNREQLRQALLELHYELLEEAEAHALRDAIESDPEVAAEWASIRRLAEQITDAASLQQVALPEIVFNTPQVSDEDMQGYDADAAARRRILQGQPGENGKHDVAAQSQRLNQIDQTGSVQPAVLRRPWSWATSASVAAMAAMLGMLLIGSWYFARLPQAPAAVIRLQARQVPPHLAKSDHEFRVFTSRIDRASPAGSFPVTPASLSFSVLARETVLFSGTARTDEAGSTSIRLPQELVIPPDATLQVTAESDQGSTEPSSIALPLEPTRCVTYLTVDRPVYRPGEMVYFRSLTLRRKSLEADSEFPIRFELRGPDGTLVAGAFLEGVTERGVGNGMFEIPDNAMAGSYTLHAKSLDGFFPELRCEFQVRAYRAPRFNKSLQFVRPSYAPGETVDVEFSASLVTGEPLADATVQVVAMAGDRIIYQLKSRTTPTGTCDVAFPLPATIEQGRVELSVTVEDQGIRETEVAEVPIQFGQVSVEFYPEGGYLVDGIENRVYFTALDALGAPVHLEGEVIDSDGNRLAAAVTVRDGMGVFSIRPTAGQPYRLQVNHPTGVQSNPRLPEVVADLPVIDTGIGVFAAGEPITIVVRDDRERSVLVRMACRGQLVSEHRLSLLPAENRIELSLPPDTGGVVRVTILDALAKPARPLVERLVYRRPSRRLQLDVLDEPSKLVRSPGDSLSLTLQARDEKGDPIAATLGVSVVDDAAWSLDSRDRPSLRTEFLLLSEVESPEQLEHADFYLSDDPEAARSLDLLLGTQGWRRFISPAVGDSQVDFREQLIRLLELDGDTSIASARFDNANLVASEWYQYQQTVDEAWRRLLVEVRVLVVLIVSIWFAAFLIYRRGATSSLACCLLLGSSSLLIYGCGASQEAMVVDAPASDARSAAVASERVDSRADPTAPNQRPSAIAAENGIPAAELSGDAASALAMETPPQLVDWLDDAKVAWLLRISERSQSQPSDPQHAGATSAGPSSQGQSLITPQQLRELMASRGLDAEGLADELLQQLRFPIRQYAHRRAAPELEESDDFAETLYWQPLLMTDESGQATIEFDLPDTVTTFRIRIDGHAAQGRIGSGNASIITAEVP